LAPSIPRNNYEIIPQNSGEAGMPLSNNQFVDALKQQGGCGLLFYLFITIWFIIGIYQVVVFGFGDDKIESIKDFANECFNREESKAGKLIMEMSESERAHIDDVCSAEYEDYLAREPWK
jgi:hypothetical protein